MTKSDKIQISLTNAIMGNDITKISKILSNKNRIYKYRNYVIRYAAYSLHYFLLESVLDNYFIASNTMPTDDNRNCLIYSCEDFRLDIVKKLFKKIKYTKRDINKALEIVPLLLNQNADKNQHVLLMKIINILIEHGGDNLDKIINHRNTPKEIIWYIHRRYMLKDCIIIV